MIKTELMILMIVLTVFGPVSFILAEPYSIYDIQYTTDPNGNSPLDGVLINECCGGIVVFKGPSWIRPKLALYDPDYPYGWGGIEVKDINDKGYFDKISVGDDVRIVNVKVEEFRGTTFLQMIYGNEPNIVVISRNNPLPEPLSINVNEIAAPVYQTEPKGWLVADHNSEKYEGMLIKVIDVNVKDIGYGKEPDNYILESNVNPNLTCWASDYMNIDKGGGPIYHPSVTVGQRFCGVSGILEQYTGEVEGIYYDYYQLLTTSTESFIIEQTADFDDDCDVDFADFGIFAEHWLQSGCAEPDWCGGADLVHDVNATVDMFDLSEFVQHWLEGK